MRLAISMDFPDTEECSGFNTPVLMSADVVNVIFALSFIALIPRRSSIYPLWSCIALAFFTSSTRARMLFTDMK